ncbi:MAG TPA: DinB family protein [Puia sp.]
MKNTLFMLATLAIFAFTATPKTNSGKAGTLTPEERAFMVKYMTESRDALIADVAGLSPNQLSFKASPERWSVADCVEHIALAETKLTPAVKQGLSAPAEPGRRDSIRITDEQLMNGLVDRSHKFQAPEMLRPSGNFKTTQEALDVFVEQRNKNIEYVKTTNDDLRNHFFMHPAVGTIDIYQGMIFITGHSKRHTLQLEEVKADPNFPKN